MPIVSFLYTNEYKYTYYSKIYSYMYFKPFYSYIYFYYSLYHYIDQKVLNSSFMFKKNTLTKGVAGLKESLEVVRYIHDKNYSQNYIKCNNIFLSNARKDVSTDFGFLTAEEKPILKYVAPMTYLCPEGRLTEAGLTPIDRQKWDIWTVGMLAFEMFTVSSDRTIKTH